MCSYSVPHPLKITLIVAVAQHSNSTFSCTHKKSAHNKKVEQTLQIDRMLNRVYFSFTRTTLIECEKLLQQQLEQFFNF